MKEDKITLAPQIYTYEYDGRKEWGFFELGKLKTLVHAENDPDLKICDLYRLDPRRITNLQPFSVFGEEVEVTKVTKNKYGNYSNEIDKILEKITNFSLDDRSRLAADAAYDAADAAYDATYAAAAADAATYAAAYAATYAAAAAAAADAYAAADYYRDNWWKFRRVFWYAILAWLAKDEITSSQFDLLMTGYNAYIKSENA